MLITFYQGIIILLSKMDLNILKLHEKYLKTWEFPIILTINFTREDYNKMSKLKLSFEIWPNMPWGRLDNCGPAWNSWGDKSLDWCINKIGEYGYEGFDVVYPKIQEIQPSDYDDQVSKMKKAADKHGLAFSSIACHTTFVSPRFFDRENGIAKFKRAVDAAHDMGAETVVTLVGDGYYDPPLYN